MGMAVRGATGGLGCGHGQELEWSRLTKSTMRRMIGSVGRSVRWRERPGWGWLAGAGVGGGGPNQERDAAVLAAAIDH